MTAAKGALDFNHYVALGLTHVQYDSRDGWAKLMALVTLSPIFLLCSYVTIVIYRRELTFINALVGQLGCEGVNWGLKRLIRQPRPHPELGKGYGMPSSHSQFMGFFCAFFVAHFVLHHPKRADPPTLVNFIRRLEHLLAIVCIVLLAALTCYSRHHLAYHSIPQIFTGLGVGVFIGIVYYYLTEHIPRQPIRLPAPLGSPISSPVSSPYQSKRQSITGLPARDSSLRRRTKNGDSHGAMSPSSGTGPMKRSSSDMPHRRRSSLGAIFIPELHPAPPIRQLILDHPIAVAFRIRDSWTVWLDGGIEGEYEAWRSEWQRIRRPYPGARDDRRPPPPDGVSAVLSRWAALNPQGMPQRDDISSLRTGLAPSPLSPTSPPNIDKRRSSLKGSNSLAVQSLTSDIDSATRAGASGGASNFRVTSEIIPFAMMKLALREAAKCEPTTTAFCVGCVITLSGTNVVVATGYSRELPTNTHAEECALRKLLQISETQVSENKKTDGLSGLTQSSDAVELDLYTTMEPCSERLSGSQPCVQRILSFNGQQPCIALPSSIPSGLDTMSSSTTPTYPSTLPVPVRIAHVYQGVLEPADFIASNTGTAMLRKQGVTVMTVKPPRGVGDDSQWVEREALRLAKWGHEDQPVEKEGESRFWKQ